MTCKCDCDCPCTCEKHKLNPDGQMSSLKKFDIALQTRNFEIDMFWKRSNYFLVLNTAIAVGFVSLIKEGGYINVDVLSYTYALVFCFIGFVVCLAWVKVNLGSKYWQSHWEQILEDNAKKMDVLYFTKNTKQRVMKNIARRKIYPCWKGYYNRLILTKPSVSGWMTILSLFFLGVWILVGGFIFYYLGCVISCNSDSCISCNNLLVYPIGWVIVALLIVCLSFPKLIGLCPKEK